MLGKVFKHEMKSTSRLFLPLMIGFIAITLLCKFTFETSYSAILGNNRLMETITVIFFVLYFIYIIALFVMTSVFIVMHFYKTMVSDQGYLTNTLPEDEHSDQCKAFVSRPVGDYRRCTVYLIHLHLFHRTPELQTD